MLTRRRFRQLNGGSDIRSSAGDVSGTSVKVEEDHESDLFVSDDDDVGDRDYVQSTHSTSSDDELLPPRKEQHRRNTSTSQLESRVSCLPDPESSDKAASGSKVRLVTRIPQERTTSVFPALSDLSHQRKVKRQKKSYSSNDKRNFRWSLALLHTAICEHRWDDAFKLLPCVIIETAPHLSQELLWRVTDVVTRNVPKLTIDDRKKFRSILLGMKSKTSMFLDILSQDLSEATDRDVDELLQMIEDIQNQRLPPAQGIEMKTSKRNGGLSDGYIGLMHYQRWKNSVLNATSSSQPLDEDSCSMNICDSQGTANADKKEIARKAHSFLKKALTGLSERCEWFMLQFLELEKELYGQESAVGALERYKSDPRRAPAHHLAYQFYKNLVPESDTEQLMELECISKACPDDPLVLALVNLYLHSLDHGGPTVERAMMRMRSVESDSGQESNDDCSSPAHTNASCPLWTKGKVEVLMRCLMLLVGMLDYPCHTWDLQPWQMLTQVLTKFYQAWVRCWSCLACKNTRKRIHRLALTVVPLWKHFVWKNPPATLPLKQARVLFHHVFAAFIFNYSEEYMSRSLSTLRMSGHLLLREELMSLINFPGPFQRQFSLLAEKHRKKMEGISLRSLSQTAYQNKKAIQESQKRTQNTTITSAQAHLNQETQKEGMHNSESECEEEVLQLTPFKDSVNCTILNQETGLSPSSLKNIFDTSFEGDFITSTQTKDEKCRDQKILVRDPELNGTYITDQETTGTSQSKMKNYQSFLDLKSTKIDFGDHTESNAEVDGKQNSIESMKHSKSTTIKPKSRTQKKDKISQRKDSVSLPAAAPMRMRLSSRRFYQPFNKDNITATSKTQVAVDKNCLSEEGTRAISCLTHQLDSNRSVSNKRHVDCQGETAHEVAGGGEAGFLQLGRQKEHDGWDETETTYLKNPEKKKLLFDESLTTNTNDVNITFEDRNEYSVSSSSSAQDVTDTVTSCLTSELNSDRPENCTSGVDKKKRNEEDISTRSDKDKRERSRSVQVKHKLKNLIDSTEEKEKTPECNIKSICQHADENIYQDPNSSHIKGTLANEDLLRTPKADKSENDMNHRTIVRETETQSHDEASDDTIQFIPETPSQLNTNIKCFSTEDRCTDKMQQEEGEAAHSKQNEPVQEEENDKTRRKQSEEVQERIKSKEQYYDETDVGKQKQCAQKERKSEEEVLSSSGEGKQKEVILKSLETDVGRVCNQEYSQTSIDTIAAGQKERECTSSPDEYIPTSPCGQGFFLTQESKVDEPLLSPSAKESGIQKPEGENLNTDELKELNLGDLDHYLLRELREQYNSESIKDGENSPEVLNSHSNKTPGGLLESMSVYQGQKEGSRAGTCVTEKETLLKAEDRMQVHKKSTEPQQESPFEGRCDLQTEVQGIKKCSSSEHESPKKLEEKSVSKEHTVGGDTLPKKTQPSKRRIPTNNHERTGPPQDSQLQTPSRCPNISWVMPHVEDVPTPSMQDFVKHSDTSTPNSPGKRRRGPSDTSFTTTPKDTRVKIRRYSHMPRYPASWLEGLPFPVITSDTPNEKSKDSDAHEAGFKISESVPSSASLTKKTSRKTNMKNSDAILSDISTRKTETPSKRSKKDVLVWTGIIEYKGLEDSTSHCGKDREVSTEPAVQMSVPIVEEVVIINKKQECEVRNDVCVSVADEMDDLPIPRDTDYDLGTSRERDTSSLIETGMNVLEDDRQQYVEQDSQCGTVTGGLKDLSPNSEDQRNSLEISENVINNNNHDSMSEDFEHAIQADWLKDLPPIDVSGLKALEMSRGGNDTSKIKTQHSKRRKKSSVRVPETDWTKDLPLDCEKRQSKKETSLERVINNNNHDSMSEDFEQVDWLKDLPPIDVSGLKALEMSRGGNDTSKIKTQHSKRRRKSSVRVPETDWIKDLPLDCEKRQSKKETSLERDIIQVPEDKDPTRTPTKQSKRRKSKRQESLMRWTEDLPLDIEKIPANLRKLLNEHNTSQVDNIASSTNQSMDKENNQDQSVTGPVHANDLTYNSEQGEETCVTSPHSRSKFDQGSEAPSKKHTRAEKKSAIESNTDITGKEHKVDGKKGPERVEEIKKKPKKKKKSSDENLSHTKVIDPICMSAQEDSVRGDECEKGKRDLREEKEKRNTNQERERGGCDQRNITHEECKEGTSCYGAIEDLEDEDKRKKKKTKAKQYKKQSKDNSQERNAGNVRHEECERESSCYGASDIDDGSKRRKRNTNPKGYERESRDKNQENSGNVRHEDCKEKSSHLSTCEEDSELKGSKHRKETPYKVETIWHSSSDLTVTTSKRKRTGSDKQELSQYSTRPSKRRMVESSRRGSECSTPSNRDFSITVCNQVESLSNIQITLCRSPGSDSAAASDKGIKVMVQFSDRNFVTGSGGELCTPIAGRDDSCDPRQSVDSPRVCTPHRSQPSAGKRKLFEDDSS